MSLEDEVEYRVRLADGFLGEARQDFGLGRWRSCVDNSQLAAENVAKAVLGLLGPVGRTHNPATLLMQALREGRVPSPVVPNVRRIAECARRLGPQVHIESDYGDEATRRTPWELFAEADARDAFRVAEEAIELARQVIQEVARP
jgi:HEPN domain-containing protein